MNDLSSTIDFKSLGGEVSIQAEGEGSGEAIDQARKIVLDLHDTLTRFEAASELSRLNSNQAPTVKVSPIMLRFSESLLMAGETSGGLVDATLLAEVERAGYTESLDPDSEGPLVVAAPDPARSVAERESDWSAIKVDRAASTVTRPPGLRIDSGGIGKGLAADLVAERLEGFESWSVVCAGDLRFGGSAGTTRQIDVRSPLAGGVVIAEYRGPSAAVATSGITRRSWRKPGRDRSHHLIDPRTGLPAQTGIIQATAVAATGLEAEVRAKAALLSGPDHAAEWLPDGGVIVTDRLEVMTWSFERKGPL